jgi:UDP-3-O-[3-hydroxymyristoyl] glucosamine N-acyltransferase
MNQTPRQIADLVHGELTGPEDSILTSVASLKNAGPSDLSYAEAKFHNDAAQSRAGCLIVSSGSSGPPGAAPLANRSVIVVKNPKVAFANAAVVLLRKSESDPPIHPTAVIDPGAVVGSGTRVGAGCVVGRNVKIGVGCVLYPRVVVYPNVEIGNNVIIHAGAVIGADGFGFVKDGERYVPFPQVGAVIIEDDVEIGANTCVDRGSLETTVIRRGTKIDNLVQIAHNVEVGEHTVIAAQTGISGSSIVGPHSIIAGQVGIGEHARLDAHTILGGQAGVLNGKHVRGGEILWGTPARPLKEFLEQQAHLARLPKWIREIKHRLGIREKSDS